MDTLDYVKKYQEELKDKKKYSLIFNIWAFLFSSLYFFYKRMYLHFIIFFVVPVILNPILEPIVGKNNAYLMALLIMHLIAGFIANPHYKKYLHNYIENHKNAQLDKIVSYASMPMTKLILCMVLSFGLYSLYWGYKHWKTYQETTKDDISPFARGWLIHLTAPSLFSKIGKSINSNIKLQYFGIGFLFSALISTIIDKYLEFSENIFIVYLAIVLELILFAMSIFFLVIVQKKINDYNISHSNEKVEMTLNVSEVVIILVGFLLVGILPFVENNKTSSFYLDEYTKEQQEKIGASVGFIYRHTKGYTEVCQKEGYILRKYPNEFSQYFSNEINALKNNLSIHNYTIENIENNLLDNSLKTKMITTIYTELENIKKLIIMSQVAEGQGISIEDVIWKDEWDNLIQLKDICKILDEHGVDVLKESENKYFLKANAL